MTTKNTGDIWEVTAIKYLQKHGYRILDTNFRFKRFWEIDIVAKKQNQVVFIEVKYRNNTKYWLPEESITYNKLRKCLKTIDFYIKKHQINPENARIDVIAILRENTSYKLTHYRNIDL